MNGPNKLRTSAERKLSASSATGTGIIANVPRRGSILRPILKRGLSVLRSSEAARKSRGAPPSPVLPSPEEPKV